MHKEVLARELYSYLSVFKLEAMREQMNLFDTAAGNLQLKEVGAVMLLGEAGECKMREMADRLNIALSTMTGIVDRLVMHGYVFRKRTKSDRRVVLVSLTKKGEKLNNWIQEQSIAVYIKMFDALTDREQKTLVELFRKIVVFLQGQK